MISVRRLGWYEPQAGWETGFTDQLLRSLQRSGALLTRFVAMLATKRAALCYLAMQRYDLVHSPDGVELGVMPAIAEDLKAAWLIARQSFPNQHVIVLVLD